MIQKGWLWTNRTSDPAVYDVFLIPMMVGLMVLSKPLVKLIYERGSFDALGTEMTGTALCFFAVGMIGYGVQTILSRVFYAKQEGKMPLVAGIISIGVNAALCWLLMKPMGLGGLALASAVSSTVAALILFVPTVKQYPGILDKNWRRICVKWQYLLW